MVTPGLSRAMTFPATRTSRSFQFCGPTGNHNGGGPWCMKLCGITPITVNGRSSSVIALPTIS
jgi:hypothetical protein